MKPAECVKDSQHNQCGLKLDNYKDFKIWECIAKCSQQHPKISIEHVYQGSEDKDTDLK